MKRLERGEVTWLLRFFLLLVFLLIVYLLRPVMPFLWQLAEALAITFLLAGIAFIAAYLLLPAVRLLERSGLSTRLAVSLVFSTGVMIMLAAVRWGFPVFAGQWYLFLQVFPDMIAGVERMEADVDHWLRLLPPSLYEDAADFFSTQAKMAEEKWHSELEKLPERMKWLLLLALVPFLSFYFLLIRRSVRNWLLNRLSARTGQSVHSFGVALHHQLGGYLKGQVFLVIAVSVLTSLLFYLIGLPFAIVLGTVAGVLNLIPYIGPVLAALPAILIALTVSPVTVVWVVLIMIGIQVAEGSVLSPVIVGKSVQEHPAVIMLLLVFGGEAAGIAGLLFIVPLYIIVRVTVTHFLIARKA